MKTFPDLEHRLELLLAAQDCHPLAERELARRLQLAPGQRGRLRSALRSLEARGRVVLRGGGRWGPPGTPGAAPLIGTVRIHPNGSAWILPENGTPPLRLTSGPVNLALPGDRILAASLRKGSSCREARLLRILERKRKQIVGTVEGDQKSFSVVPRDPLLPSPFPLAGSSALLQRCRGRLVVARLSDSSAGRPGLPTAMLARELGDPNDPALDIPALLLDRSLEEEFPPDVERAARSIFSQFVRQGADPAARVDLRNDWIVTIDPETARDYDDAISIVPAAGGGWILGVHIADVAAYVPPGSRLDEEARRRGNSIYLPDRVVRMLPRDLTVRVCSLQPDEDHLAHTVQMHFDARGRLREARTFRSVIRSKACLSYEQAQAFLDTGRLSGAPAELGRTLIHLRTLARTLRARRFRGGALDFSLPEITCHLDARGRPVEFRRRAALEAYQLIEECMLAANQVVAEQIWRSGLVGLYRIHEAPSREQWARMNDDLCSLGIHTAVNSPADLQRLARAIAGRPEETLITLTLLRHMPRAKYSAECRPHFGLGFTRYVHFTSPIRRYADLVIHRLLAGLAEGRQQSLYTASELEAIAAHCSETERVAAEVEIQALHIKRIRYYAERLRRGETGPYRGIVTARAKAGLVVELEESLLTGILPEAERERRPRSRARPPGPVSVGATIQVRLSRVDERTRRVEFLPAETLPPLPPAPPKKNALPPPDSIDKSSQKPKSMSKGKKTARQRRNP